MTNPLAALPRKVRIVVYSVLGLVALALTAYQASEGDWVEGVLLFLGSLGFGTAVSNITPEEKE